MKPETPPAYPETYLDDAMRTLGEAVDWAAHVRKLPPERFFAAFVASGLADEFGAGVPKIVAGLSGAELARETLRRAAVPVDAPDGPSPSGDEETPAFWTGWILAWYQWRTALPFRAILAFLPAAELLSLHPALHEASETRCEAAFDARRRARRGATALAAARKAAGLTQAELARRAGVALRSVQQWEQRAKDLGRAAARSVAALARVLGTTPTALVSE